MRGTPSRWAKIWLACACVGIGTVFFSIQASTLTVTNANDNNVSPPPGSLRQAILDANANPGSDVVFNLPGAGPFTINLVAQLPSITETVRIDGTTQIGYAGQPLIELNGLLAGSSASGLYLLAPNCVVRGLAIDQFAREGIRIETYGGNVIHGNFIGTGVYGTNSLGNGNTASGFGGITILSASNLVGGIDITNRNLISGSNKHGIFLLNATAVGNQIQGNLIGTDVTGTKRLGNAQNGIAISGGRGNQIGGSGVAARNIISGNLQSGVYLNPGSTTNLIQGNFIGTDVNGTAAISNTADGVTISGGTGNVIGGTNPTLRNVISGNGGRGVLLNTGGATANQIQGNFIGTDVNGTNKLANAYSGVEIFNASGNAVGGALTGAGNLISGNQLSGVSIDSSSASTNVVQGNLIGTDVNGTNTLGNMNNGIFISGVSNNFIGGAVPGAGNVISGNLQNGIYLADANCQGNVVQGNFIGTDLTGTRRLGNGAAGLRVEAFGNSIGGSVATSRNIVSANTNSGIYFLGLIASNNVVQGNYIGTDVTGTAPLGNSNMGLGLDNAPDNTVGGTTSTARNVISANAGTGIYVVRPTATGNVIAGNYIGTDVTGSSALGNGLGGVYITGASSNQVGGAGAGNLISGNALVGVAIGDPGANGNQVIGNLIGTRADGLNALGNGQHGVEIANTSSGNLIGGASPGEANVIAYAISGAYDGVRIRDGCTANLVRGNSIFGNGGSAVNGLGIDVSTDGVTANDACDTDTGANQKQNFPVLSAVYTGNGTWVRGTLNSVANTTYLLQFYANTLVEPSGYGEGQTFLGDAYVTTGGSCTQNFTVALPMTVPVGQLITATATDPSNNTSEFSLGLSAAPQPGLTATLSNTTHQFTLSWTNTANGFGLQQTTNLSPPIVWAEVTNTPVVMSGQNVVTLSTDSEKRFFRLTFP
ncbi:MAG: hypothetical protein HY298_19395 [Verrucomicrobia bacterium]|nr:hypothetical protein [Verrucomicrobiota bacterium]